MGLFSWLRPSKSASAHPARPSIILITVHEAHEAIQAGTRILIDVRKPEEWSAVGRPAGALGLTLQDPDFERKLAAIVGGDTEKALAFSCKTGGRSSQAAERAAQAGYGDVANVEGGFLAWQAAALPIDTGPFD
ncbi:MAG: rhodanese-like domain-containing protein [Pseudomonadota bacterium]